MNDFPDGGRRQLLESQASGLSAAWRRAAEDETRRCRETATQASEPVKGKRESGARMLWAALVPVALVLGLTIVDHGDRAGDVEDAPPP